MVDSIRVSRAEVYHNTLRLSLAEIKERTGCTHIINGWLFNNKRYSKTYFEPCNWLIVDGKVISSDNYNDYGFVCGKTGPPVMSTDRTRGYFLTGVPLLKNGQKLSRSVDAAVARKSERTAVGWFSNGRVFLWCSKEKMTIEELKNKLLSLGVSDALLMDGGGSVQGIFPYGEESSDRLVATAILLWEASGTTPTKDPEEETPMFKIALGAGHGINTAGKRCMKALDPNETREWWLNDRICDYVESYLKAYDGYKLLRLDDSDDGKDNIPLADRVKAANDFGADIYLSVHHNAGINGGSGGGIVVYVHPNASATSKAWQIALYDALIKHTGLKGNRSQPKATGDYYVLRHTKMAAALLELGFLDSKTDVPIILTNEYAQQCARAIVEVIVARGKLTKKAEPETGVLYKVQVGAFAKKENADKLLADLKAKGYPCYIVRV